MGISGIYRKIKHYTENVDILQYIYYNYICKNVVRKGAGRLVPYKHSVIQLDKGAKIIIHSGDLILGTNRLLRSREETLVRLGVNATWECTAETFITFGGMIEIKKNATLKNGSLLTNHGVVIVSERGITIGDGCYFGRNVIVYDTDSHQITDAAGSIKNYPREVVIGDRVWLTNNITVLKGVHIANGVVVSPYAVLRKSVAVENALIGGLNCNDIIQSHIEWNPKGFS